MTEKTAKTAKSVKKFPACKETSKFIREDYENMYKAKEEGRPIAWLTGIGPLEILDATDIVSIVPENYNAFSAAKQMGGGLCEEAELRGYPKNVCSYGKLCMGYTLTGKGPYGALPEPDILVCTRSACTTHIKWWQMLAEYFNKPLFTIDCPEAHGERPTEAQLQYWDVQIDKFRNWLKDTTGQVVTDARLEESVNISQQTSLLWQEMTELRKLKPCPIGSSDVFNQMFLSVTKPATKRANEILTQLVGEVKEAVVRGEGVVEHEKYRLLWDNIAIWYNLGLMNYLEEAGAVSVIETYSTYCGWGKVMDMSEGPVRALATKYMPGYLNLALGPRVELMKKLAKDFSLDGAILLSNRSCKPYSVGQYDIKMALEEVGVKSVMIEADMVDERDYSAATVDNRLDAFLEMLESNKNAK